MAKSSKPRKKYNKQKSSKFSEKYKKQSVEIRGLPEYYQLAFEYYDNKYTKDLSEKVLSFRMQLREGYASKLKDKYIGNFEKDKAYDILFKNLEYLSAKFDEKIKCHSAVYWLHLYRRFRPGLLVDKGEKADDGVLFAIRYYVETAILKYSNLTLGNDLCLLTETSYHNLLDGLFYESLVDIGRTKEEIERLWTVYQRSEQWVLKNFKRDDITTIYYLESIAYEYWKTVALMRAVAKGSKICINKTGMWSEDRPDLIDRLILRFDQRLDIERSYLSTSKGLLSIAQEPEYGKTIIAAAYNAKQHNAEKVFGKNDYVDKNAVTNFYPQFINFQKFIDDHDLYLDLYKEQYSFSLENVLFFFKYLSDLILHNRSLGISSTDVEDDAKFYITYWQFLQRAYSLINLSTEELSERIIQIAKVNQDIMNIDLTLFQKDLPKILQFFLLDSNKQNSMSIWSFGPRAILIPYGKYFLIDMAGLGIILDNIFLGLREDPLKRGAQFEDIVRDAIKNKGYNLLDKRKLKASKNVYRETDLAIRLGNILVLIDCRSMETPIRHDIGYPDSLERRNREVIKKNDQVISIAEFVRKNPKGSNYDFSWAETIISFAVTVDVEWIPTEDPTFWLDEDKNIPIVMSVEECFTFLDELRGNE